VTTPTITTASLSTPISSAGGRHARAIPAIVLKDILGTSETGR